MPGVDDSDDFELLVNLLASDGIPADDAADDGPSAVGAAAASAVAADGAVGWLLRDASGQLDGDRLRSLVDLELGSRRTPTDERGTAVAGAAAGPEAPRRQSKEGFDIDEVGWNGLNTRLVLRASWTHSGSTLSGGLGGGQ